MKRLILKQTAPKINRSIDHLHSKCVKWISEIEFIQLEQRFLRELLVDHIMDLCETCNYKYAKLYLSGIEHENKLGKELIDSVKEHKVNLSLLMENIYMKREDAFRQNHEELKMEVKNYKENFNYIKEKVFEIILNIMKRKKTEKLMEKNF